MNKVLATGLAGVFVLAASAYSQGTVEFQNYYGNLATDPAVYFADGVTRVQGSQYLVGLMAGPTTQTLALCATTTFVTDPRGAGFFNGPVVFIPNVSGGFTAFIQIDVWDTTLGGTTTGATFDQALAFAQVHGQPNIYGQSTVFSIITGNPYSPGVPGLPAPLVPGLTSFALVPEPGILPMLAVGFLFVLVTRARELESHRTSDQ